jgi:oxygen-independent coproporphyrinogen-3 oxidase
MEFERMPTNFMSKRGNHNCASVAAAIQAASPVAEFCGAHAPTRAAFGASPNVKRPSERFPSVKRFPARAPEVRAGPPFAREARALPDPQPSDAPATTGDMIRHLYVHIPFCARICPYCAFYKDLLDRSQTQRFCQAALRELEWHAKSQNLSPLTIYFGGGTPTALSTSQLEMLLRGFHQQLDLSHVVEWTFEANPGSVSPRKAELLGRFGVNRVSLGVQSWDDRLLKLLGREHSVRQAAESLQILRAAGFANINIDLMFALPGQTCTQWRATLERTISLQPEHISTYCLTYEEDTEFFQRHSNGEFQSDSDVEGELFEMTMSILQEAGYEHYEISNYARAGFASVHNQAY